ncbi:dUTP diphosphatase [Kocuria sp.]|uniref:dUTP diphosphatase n=1 Tax=Kocuria sp. TaxID=1871328 RepID=UPI0026DDB133|nr:dUTP diphosphatase [Kocuria sp.]MDO4919788.1 dUTP diphosphatase [Kocuria sp.]
MTDESEPTTVGVALHLLDPELPAPAYARAGDAGADLRARHDVELAPGERALVDTGVAVAVPEGHVGLVHPRSGLAAKHGITVLNAPGTVDSGYRGELKVCLLNTDPRESYTVRRGERIAQLVLQEVVTARFELVAELPASERGTRGFGSSGTH